MSVILQKILISKAIDVIADKFNKGKKEKIVSEEAQTALQEIASDVVDAKSSPEPLKVDLPIDPTGKQWWKTKKFYALVATIVGAAGVYFGVPPETIAAVFSIFGL